VTVSNSSQKESLVNTNSALTRSSFLATWQFCFDVFNEKFTCKWKSRVLWFRVNSLLSVQYETPAHLFVVLFRVYLSI